MIWTDEKVEELRKLWAKGYSASQIADSIGGVTRNAVIGKVHRLGLSGRLTVHRSKRQSTALRRQKANAGRQRLGNRTGKVSGVAHKALFEHEVDKMVASGVPRAEATGAAASAINAKFGRQTMVTGLDVRPPADLVPATFLPASTFEMEGELVIPLGERKTLQTLDACSCRWPIGDPRSADFHFCGKNKVPGLPYCEFHARRAYQLVDPAVRRRSRKPAQLPSLSELEELVK